jgi:hypothetical protein
MMRLPLLLLLGLLPSCAHGPDRDSACRVAHLERDNLRMMSVRELVVVAAGSPVESRAESAYNQSIAAQVLGAIGSAALISAFIEGFAGDPATNEGVRISAWTLGGTALATFATALILGITGRNAAERARRDLADWADHCP